MTEIFVFLSERVKDLKFEKSEMESKLIILSNYDEENGKLRNLISRQRATIVALQKEKNAPKSPNIHKKPSMFNSRSVNNHY